MLHKSKPNTPTGNHGESQSWFSPDVDLGLSDAQILADIDKSMAQGNRSPDGSSDSEEQSEQDYAAFRTITTFLHIIQRWPDLRRSNIQERNPDIWPNDRLVLKLCNAFATLSVMQHEIVAVGVAFHPVGREPPVDLLLSMQEFENFDILFNENPRGIHLTELNEIAGNQIRVPNPPKALKEALGAEPPSEQPFNENPRESHLTESNKIPGNQIGVPNPPDALKEALGAEPQNKNLLRYLMKLKVTSDNPTLGEHIWMLQTIFNTFKSKQDIQDPLMHYLVVTCFPKMWARIDHPRSAFYTEVLGSIQPRGSGFIKSEVPLASLETSNTSPGPVVFNEPAKKNAEDLQFLKVLVSRRDFGEDEFPVLHKRYTETNQQLDVCLYDEETCQEFCSVVNLVLKGFRESLSVFASYRLALIEKKENPKKPHKDAYFDVYQYGYMLHMLCRGAALPMYLKNVNPLLSDFHRPAPKRVYLFKEKSANKLVEIEREEPEAEKEELGVELEDGLEADNKDFEFSAEPEEESAEKGPHAWQICLRWIKLLVSYFSAASMLINHLSIQQFPIINVHLLRNSPGDNTLLSWKTLLKDPSYFPSRTLDPRDRTNEEIISMLEQAISFKPSHHGFRLQHIREDWEEIMKDEPADANKRLEIAEDFDRRFQAIEATIGIRGCLKYARDISNRLKNWKGARPGTTLSSLILNDIDSMVELCYVLSQFEKPGDFKGTVHCEANIANFLSNRNPQSQVPKEYGRIIAVSKNNCPSCHTLLGILEKDGRPFLSRGPHKIVFPCSLPLNLKQSVVDKMNKKFGAQLRKELLDFLNDMESRPRSYSSGSNVSSKGSAGMPNSPYHQPVQFAIESDEEE